MKQATRGKVNGNGHAATLNRPRVTPSISVSVSSSSEIMKRYRAILLFGAPGSGKGTQGKIIGTIPGFYHSATGDIFRSLDLQSDMGRKFWEYSSRGQLVPDEFTIKLWKRHIQGMEMINQFRPDTEFLVLDGLPRSAQQADLLVDTIDVIKVVYLRAERAKMVERLRRRALKENRIDDASDEVIDKRMEVFEKETRPVLDKYPSDRIIRIDATLSQIRVLGEIVKHLTPLKEALDRESHEADAVGHA
jgi:adenylate kinase